MVGTESSHYTGDDYLSRFPKFDCSGFVTYLLRQLLQQRNLPVPADIRHANEYFDRYGVLVHQASVTQGDLVFFSRDGIKPTHMGIVIDDKHYVHSPGTDNERVQLEIIEESEIEGGEIYTINPIGYKRIAIPSGRFNII